MNLIKKAQELARLAKVLVTVVVYDPMYNVLQEFNSASDFTLSNIMEHQEVNCKLDLGPEYFRNVRRKRYPQKNYLEKINMDDYLQHVGLLMEESEHLEDTMS